MLWNRFFPRRWYFGSYRGSKASDTIFALSTAPGKAGVAVVRISGPRAALAVAQATLGTPPKPRCASLRSIVHPVTKRLLDRGLVICFAAPHSFTGEDVVELHLHGGKSVVGSTLQALASLEGFRFAERGEFARRAFEHGRLDLTELEGIADLINAETEAQQKQALRQAEGGLKRLYSRWRGDMVRSLALVEAIIDFGEDESLEEGVFAQVSCGVAGLVRELSLHLKDCRRGEILREGIQMVIFGLPNAGKSSLLNALVNRQAAIVSEIPGTTRDILEVTIDVAGYPVVVSDTAGLRPTLDIIEQEGVYRAKQRIEHSDLCLCILDLKDIHTIDQALDAVETTEIGIDQALDAVETTGPTRNYRDLFSLISHQTVVVLNKCDCVQNDASRIASLQKKLQARLGVSLAIPVSCLQQGGLHDFLLSLSGILEQRFGDGAHGGAVITQARHRVRLEASLGCLHRFMELGEQHVVLAAEELRLAALHLGKITGSVDVEEVLDAIFKEFCIGK